MKAARITSRRKEANKVVEFGTTTWPRVSHSIFLALHHGIHRRELTQVAAHGLTIMSRYWRKADIRVTAANVRFRG